MTLDRTLGAVDLDFATMQLQDALDLAVLIEEESEERYQQFVTIIGDRYAGDAADVFRYMAANEARHGQQLRDRRRTLFGDAPVRIRREDLWDVEAPSLSLPRAFMSTHQAFEIALIGEYQAEQFFANALPFVTDPEVGELFIELHAEEEEHVVMLERHMRGLDQGPDIAEADLEEPPAL